MSTTDEQIKELESTVRDRAFDRLWMIGQPGAGKSHMTRWLASHTMAMTIHVGELLRQKHGDDYFTNHKESSLAPLDVEVEAMELVAAAIKQAAAQDTVLIVDSLKHPRQVEVIPSHDRDVVIMVETDPKQLRERMRDAKDSRKRLWAAANKE